MRRTDCGMSNGTSYDPSAVPRADPQTARIDSVDGVEPDVFDASMSLALGTVEEITGSE